MGSYLCASKLGLFLSMHVAIDVYAVIESLGYSANNLFSLRQLATYSNKPNHDGTIFVLRDGSLHPA